MFCKFRRRQKQDDSLKKSPKWAEVESLDSVTGTRNLEFDQNQQLTIENFDNHGEIFNPSVPCVADSIDPNYIGDANARQPVRKFLVKSDILQLRDITRTKFFLYTHRELALKKERERKFNDVIYEDIKSFYDFCYRKLSQTESEAFEAMRQKYDELTESRRDRRLIDEKKRLEMEQQRVYMNVFHIYQRFRYLLKLIEYFDHVSEACEDIAKFNRAINEPQLAKFLDAMPMKHGPYETSKLMELIQQKVRPYLEKKKHMDAEVWQMSYQIICQKMSEFNQNLTAVAMLDHLIEVVSDKFTKTNLHCLRPRQFGKDVKFLENRIESLQIETNDLFDNWVTAERNDTVKPTIDGIVPVMVRKLQLDTKPMNITEKIDQSTVDKLQKIQIKLMSLLYELDKQPAEERIQIERAVRKRAAQQQIASKQALVIQTRFKNLVEHYRQHYIKKNIVRGYQTLIPRWKPGRRRNRIQPVKSKEIS